MINYKNSQYCYCGFWVPQNIPFSTFENKFIEFNNTPFQIIQHDLYNRGYVIDNPKKKHLQKILDNFQEENYNIDDDQNCFLI
jgi:hypothetical protein